jgi:hypothetical protein
MGISVAYKPPAMPTSGSGLLPFDPNVPFERFHNDPVIDKNLREKENRSIVIESNASIRFILLSQFITSIRICHSRLKHEKRSTSTA